MIMRRFLLMVFVLCSLNVFAFHFGRSVGKKVEFCAYRFEDQYFLILQFEDDDNCRLTQSAIVKFKLKDGSVIRLSGFDSSQKTEHGYGMGIGTLIVNHLIEYAKQNCHLRRWRTDRIGYLGSA